MSNDTKAKINEVLQKIERLERNGQWSMASEMLHLALGTLYDHAYDNCEKKVLLAVSEKHIDGILKKIIGDTAGDTRGKEIVFTYGKLEIIFGTVHSSSSVYWMLSAKTAGKCGEFQQHKDLKNPDNPEALRTLMKTLSSGDTLLVRCDLNDKKNVSLAVCAKNAPPDWLKCALGYCWAHYGWAFVNLQKRMHKTGPALPNAGIRPILLAAHSFRVALALYGEGASNQANRRWALAHIGETYRIVANAVSRAPFRHGESTHSRSISHEATPYRHYLLSLIYFDKAIKDGGSTYSWAHAHFGAAVVNARAFYALEEDGEKPIRTAIKKLCKFSSNTTENEALSVGLLVLEKASHCLTTAQSQSSYYYPWAQAYYSGLMLVRTTLQNIARLDGTATAKDIAETQNSTLESMFALTLDPNLLREVYEPGNIYVNAFIEIGMLYFAAGKHDLAWPLFRRAMHLRFSFDFLPVYGILGLAIIATVAHSGMPKEAAAKETDKSFPENDGVAFDVPETRIKSEVELVKYLHSHVGKFCSLALDSVQYYLAEKSGSEEISILRAQSSIKQLISIVESVKTVETAAELDKLDKLDELDKLDKLDELDKLAELEAQLHYYADKFGIKETQMTPLGSLARLMIC